MFKWLPQWLCTYVEIALAAWVIAGTLVVIGYWGARLFAVLRG